MVSAPPMTPNMSATSSVAAASWPWGQGRRRRSRGLPRGFQQALSPRRQIHYRTHARRVVLDPESAVMQPGDGGDERQAEPRAWFAPALLQPHEALQYTLPVPFRNARSVVADNDQYPPAVGLDADDDLSLLAGLAWVPVFDRVLDEVDEGLPEQFAIAPEADARADIRFEDHVVVLGNGAVELGHIFRHGAHIHICESTGGRAGLGSGDHQQRIEGTDQLVALRDGCLE